jgi:hypothetical protein
LNNGTTLPRLPKTYQNAPQKTPALNEDPHPGRSSQPGVLLRPSLSARANRFIGGDLYQAFHVVRQRYINNISRPQHIVGNRFFNIGFQQRYVLERCSVEDDQRAVLFENHLQAGQIPHIGIHRPDR